MLALGREFVAATARCVAAKFQQQLVWFACNSPAIWSTFWDQPIQRAKCLAWMSSWVWQWPPTTLKKSLMHV